MDKAPINCTLNGVEVNRNNALEHLKHYRVKNLRGKFITGRWFNDGEFCQFECDGGGWLFQFDVKEVKDI